MIAASSLFQGEAFLMGLIGAVVLSRSDTPHHFNNGNWSAVDDGTICLRKECGESGDLEFPRSVPASALASVYYKRVNIPISVF